MYIWKEMDVLKIESQQFFLCQSESGIYSNMVISANLCYQTMNIAFQRRFLETLMNSGWPTSNKAIFYRSVLKATISVEI